MNPILLDAMSASELFRSLSEADRLRLAAQIGRCTHHYQRGEMVGLEDEACTAMGLVLSGAIHVQRFLPSGKILTIDTLHSGSSFGEAIIFSDHNRYPATLTASAETTVAMISRAEVVRMGAEFPQFLTNFLTLLSNKILMLNRKIKILSFTTVRQKVAHYLLEEQRRQHSDHLHLPYSRGELADALGLPRPSLSRELAALKAEGWIDYERDQVQILHPEPLEKAIQG